MFLAYKAKTTPAAISPFMVRVISPEIIPADFWILVDKNLSVSAVEGKPDWTALKIENVQTSFLGLELETANTHQSSQRSDSAVIMKCEESGTDLKIMFED